MIKDIGKPDDMTTPTLVHRTEKQRIEHFRQGSTPHIKTAHAFHTNLPSNYTDKDGVSLVTKYAERKADEFVSLVYSIRLSNEMFNGQGNATGEDDIDDSMETSENETLVRFC